MSSDIECAVCHHEKAYCHDKTRKESQRYFCQECWQTFANTFDPLYNPRQVSEEYDENALIAVVLCNTQYFECRTRLSC